MLHVHPSPALRDPLLLAAFEGWNDAGEAATRALGHLAKIWHAQQIAEMDSEDYFDYQVNRPHVSMRDGNRVITWPTTRFLLATRTGLPRDVVLVQGIEPSTRWKQFATEITGVAQQLGITTAFTLGAMLTPVPHTRPLPVMVSSDDPVLGERFGAEPSGYEGPTGIVGILARWLSDAGIPTLSTWVSVPHYAGGPPSPKAALSLVAHLESALGVTIPRGDLDEESRAWEDGVDALAKEEEDVAEYVTSLEQEHDATDLPEASGDAIALEFERYLKRRDDQG